MPDSTNTQLAPLIERARKVLQYEQRGNHQDRVVKGGLELFVVRWADEVSAICKTTGLDLKPIYRFTEYLEGYRRQDPMQRASSLRTALSVLDELEQNKAGDKKGNHPQTDNPGKAVPEITKASSFRDDLEEVKREFEAGETSPKLATICNFPTGQCYFATNSQDKRTRIATTISKVP